MLIGVPGASDVPDGRGVPLPVGRGVGVAPPVGDGDGWASDDHVGFAARP